MYIDCHNNYLKESVELGSLYFNQNKVKNQCEYVHIHTVLKLNTCVALFLK